MTVTNAKTRDLLIRSLYSRRRVLLDLDRKRDLTHEEAQRLVEIEREIDKHEMSEYREQHS